jgi:hypothetical protein
LNRTNKKPPENTGDKDSGKKVNVLREISQQIIVTSKRKKIESVLSYEIGHYLAKNSINMNACNRMKIFQMESRSVS